MAETVSAEVLRAIAHPLRLAALVALERGERSAEELAVALDFPEAVLADHLAELAAAGLVVGGTGRGQLRSVGHGWAEVAAQLQRMPGE